MPEAARLPVIVGVGELADRPAEPRDGRSPPDLMVAALRLAEADAGARLLPALGALAVMQAASWPVARPAARLAEGLELAPGLLWDAPVGGHQPLAALQVAAAAIAAGQVEVAAIVGAEAEHTASAARRRGIVLPWMDEPAIAAPRAADAQPEVVRALGLDRPVRAYALYENALPVARGTTPAAEQAASARLWQRCAAVAAGRPAAWLRDAPDAARLLRADAGNRPVAWPYGKLMTANPAVNQGAAVLLTSLAHARAAGVREDRLVHLRGAAAAREPDELLRRDSYGRSVAQQVVLDAARALADGRAFDLLELYSCFPCVPKLALDCLGLPARTTPTVAGGLTFFGAPLNSYMIHALVAMTQCLRARPGALGLLYGQGGWLTAHHALLLSTAPAKAAPALDLQDQVRRRYGPVPGHDQARRGTAVLESFTLLHDRDGAAQQGLAICRAGPLRLLARVRDAGSIAALAQFARSPVGDAGTLRDGADGQPEWIHDLAA